jgi:hypothetical protein
MASKKALSRKSVPKRRVAPGGKAKKAKEATKRKQTLLRTPFMAAFTKAFITNQWPVAGQQRTDVVADFLAIVEVLLTVGYGLPAPTGTGAMGDRVVQFLGPTSNWPDNTAGIPPRLKGELSTVALVDVAVIVDRLLRAINSFKWDPGGDGGAPGRWPPH